MTQMHELPRQPPVDPGGPLLVLSCPFCRKAVPYPGQASDGSEAMAECELCDVYFGFDARQVYLMKTDSTAGRITRLT